MVDTIQTERLQVRPFAVGDAEAAFGWFGDAEVMRFVPNGPDLSLDATRRRIQGYCRHQAVHGFSRWVIRLRQSAEAIGDCGLLVFKEIDGIDLGFRLTRRFWGQGLATEAASAWLRVAFGELRLTRVTAFTHPANSASLAVLRKLGFLQMGTGRVMGMEALTFACDESQFKAAAQQRVPRTPGWS